MPDQRLSGISIELIDDSGTVIETTSTDRHGNYRFEHLDLGSYQIRAVLPTTLALANSKAQDITITKGEKIHAVDFVVQSMRSTSPQPPHGRSTNREPTHSKSLVENGGPSLVPIELATQPLQASMFPAKFVRRR